MKNTTIKILAASALLAALWTLAGCVIAPAPYYYYRPYYYGSYPYYYPNYPYNYPYRPYPPEDYRRSPNDSQDGNR